MDSIGDILENRAESIGSGSYDVMVEAKLIIAGLVRAQVRILGVNNGTLRVATEDAAAASEIRLQKRQILSQLNKKLPDANIKNMSVVIR